MKMVIEFIETAFAYVLATFELQFETINYLPQGHPAKKKLAYQTRQIVSGVVRFIEEVELALIAKVEVDSEDILANSARFREAIEEVSQQIPDFPILQQLKRIAKSGHANLVTDLQKAEDEVESELHDQIMPIKQKMQKILDRIDRL